MAGRALGGSEQSQRVPGGHPEVKRRVFPGGAGNSYYIFADQPIYEYLFDDRLKNDQVLGMDYRSKVFYRMMASLVFEDCQFTGRIRETKGQTEGKTVELSLERGKCAFIFDRILGCQYTERRWHRMDYAIDGDLALLHSGHIRASWMDQWRSFSRYSRRRSQ
ncbi:MAG: hypothetical protein TUN42_06850 [Dehalogenimonas sp.]